MADLCCICVIINTDLSDTGQASYSKAISCYMEMELIPRETLIILDDWLQGPYCELAGSIWHDG
jgi:hypothetical protein